LRGLEIVFKQLHIPSFRAYLNKWEYKLNRMDAGGPTPRLWMLLLTLVFVFGFVVIVAAFISKFEASFMETSSLFYLIVIILVYIALFILAMRVVTSKKGQSSDSSNLAAFSKLPSDKGTEELHSYDHSHHCSTAPTLRIVRCLGSSAMRTTITRTNMMAMILRFLSHKHERWNLLASLHDIGTEYENAPQIPRNACRIQVEIANQRFTKSLPPYHSLPAKVSIGLECKDGVARYQRVVSSLGWAFSVYAS